MGQVLFHDAIALFYDRLEWQSWQIFLRVDYQITGLILRVAKWFLEWQTICRHMVSKKFSFDRKHGRFNAVHSLLLDHSAACIYLFPYISMIYV